jgi:hypothetical protein
MIFHVDVSQNISNYLKNFFLTFQKKLDLCIPVPLRVSVDEFFPRQSCPENPRPSVITVKS